MDMSKTSLLTFVLIWISMVYIQVIFYLYAIQETCANVLDLSNIRCKLINFYVIPGWPSLHDLNQNPASYMTFQKRVITHLQVRNEVYQIKHLISDT